MRVFFSFCMRLRIERVRERVRIIRTILTESSVLNCHNPTAIGVSVSGNAINQFGFILLSGQPYSLYPSDLCKILQNMRSTFASQFKTRAQCDDVVCQSDCTGILAEKERVLAYNTATRNKFLRSHCAHVVRNLQLLDVLTISGVTYNYALTTLFRVWRKFSVDLLNNGDKLN